MLMPEQVSTGIPVLAIYDFRSKQEFIYRTNKMREITGASELIAGMYDKFLDAEPRIECAWENGEAFSTTFDGDTVGRVVYIGGGNLCILYRTRDDYVACNKVFSRIVLDKSYSLSMIVACTEWTGDFQETRTAAYRNLDMQKRVGYAGVPCNVLPYTQVDRTTFQPIAYKNSREQEELSRESQCKRDAFDEKGKECPDWKKQGRFIDEIGAAKGEDSLIAVIYSDGNSIGAKLKNNVKTVSDMRQFSLEVHRALVERTEAAIKEKLEQLDEKYRGYRVIIDHGDEITLICNAHAAPLALDAYFEALRGSGYEACAGVAICHSHDPFSVVYGIAEECCESGKKASRAEGGNASFVDFHFCRSGITGSLEQIRGAQESSLTARPYKVYDSYRLFLEAGETLAASKVTRSDLKELNRAIARGQSWYSLEYERLKAKDASAFAKLEKLANEELLKLLLFDVTGFWDVFDLRFSGSAAVAPADGEERDGDVD